MSTLYENIMSLCQENGIKGGKMCNDLGISRSTMTELKKGRKTGITAKTAQKIADYFDVPVGRVIGGADKKTTEFSAVVMSEKELEAWKTIQDTAHRVLGSAEKEKNSTPEGMELSETQSVALDLIMNMSEDQLKKFIQLAEIALEIPSAK